VVGRDGFEKGGLRAFIMPQHLKRRTGRNDFISSALFLSPQKIAGLGALHGHGGAHIGRGAR